MRRYFAMLKGHWKNSANAVLALTNLHPCLRAWVMDLHPCLRAWVMDLHPSLRAWVMDLHPSLRAWVLDLSCPSVFFLTEKIDPLKTIFLSRSFDHLWRSFFTPCSPKKASYQESNESNWKIDRSRDDLSSEWTALDPFVEEIIDP